MIAIVVVGGGVVSVVAEYVVSYVARGKVVLCRFGMCVSGEKGSRVGFSVGLGWGVLVGEVVGL